MRAILIFTFCLLMTNLAFGQRTDRSPDMEIRGVVKKDLKHLKKGDSVTVKKVAYLKAKHDIPEPLVIAVEKENTQFAIPIGDIKHLDLTPENKEDYWQLIYLKEGMYRHYDSKGYHRPLRNDLIAEAQDYLSNLRNSNLLYEDEFITDYVISLFTQVVPKNLDSKRPEKFSVAVFKCPAPDSFMLPNGTLLLSTGLLSALDSENELKAIMASEVAHLVTDHAFINVHKEIQRVKKSVFWTNVFTVALDVADIALNYDNPHYYYYPSATFVSSSVVAAMVTPEILQRLGLDYTSGQDEQADRIAENYLTMAGIPEGTLSSALTKIRKYYPNTHGTVGITRYTGVNKRMIKLSLPEETTERNYIKFMSGVTTFNAISEYYDNRYEVAYKTAEKNIARNTVSYEDYLIMARANMAIGSDEQDNLHSMELIRKAQEMSEVPILDATKQEILLLMRLKRQAAAVERLQEYVELVNLAIKEAPGESEWLYGEADWATKLITRISLF